ncbi:O-methyltransferase [Kitasatospora sp. NPDC051853]|uniref:O-methyltransferase n=1 Tax=Kitasatospora sp. NPDC051853 TaxID=3364058 RepID=UPI00378B60BB
MSTHGTDSYADRTELPPLVRRALAVARAHGFAHSCRPEQGRLLHALAAGAAGRITETGTGCGVGLAWMASAARPGVELLSVERDAGRAALAAEVFAQVPHVRVVHGDWTEIYRHAPSDLLVLDGGGNGKQTEPADPERLLTAGGVLVVDDFTPSDGWPPRHLGEPDHARLHWLGHPALRAVDLRLAPDLSTVVATRVPPG